ncbi:unnamed protein product [Strongylus vulgaris]|uniref:RUN domain-containing protein n=1 Tax=Strongylus vulgaris TaxID=40348 RepID=A0A3P7IW46_STRVU|nr:unnamed protein product [Strongylus vulgaris]
MCKRHLKWRSARLSSSDDNCSSLNDAIRVQQLEEEQERLNNSLFSLSSHFAQVQFRLKQVAEAKGEDKEALLKDLQEFAFKGCADMNELKRLRSESESGEAERAFKTAARAAGRLGTDSIRKWRGGHAEHIDSTKTGFFWILYFITDEHEVAYLHSVSVHLQKAVLDELHEKMSLDLELEKMSVADIQKHVDSALKQLVNPFKEKQQLVEQLQTQIVDLERFVSYLQKENNSQESSPAKALSSSQFIASKPKPSRFFGLVGGSGQRFQKNQLKNTVHGNHYGDERARLQLAVDATLQVLEKSEEEVVSVVRRQLCPSLKALLEHGSNKAIPLQHIWDIILFFYSSKNGRELNDAPVRKLSQSFKLENVAGKSITSKQILLTTIENIVSSHARLHRSKDAQWKAFVSAAMNEKKLPAWLRIIFRARYVVEMCYNPWSYVARTGYIFLLLCLKCPSFPGCEELYTLLEDLHKYNVELPVDLALRPFQQMKDAF